MRRLGSRQQQQQQQQHNADGDNRRNNTQLQQVTMLSRPGSVEALKHAEITCTLQGGPKKWDHYI